MKFPDTAEMRGPIVKKVRAERSIVFRPKMSVNLEKRGVKDAAATGNEIPSQKESMAEPPSDVAIVCRTIREASQ